MFIANMIHNKSVIKMDKIFYIALIIFSVPVTSSADTTDYYEIGTPIKFVEGCEADFDGDGKSDNALLIEDSKAVKLIILLNNNISNSITLFKTDSNLLRLRCVYSSELIGTTAGQGDKNKKKIHINGKYLMLFQPESSKIAFYWKDGKFNKLWLSD